MPRFVIFKEDQAPRELTVSGPLIGIGRDARNEVCLLDPYVSRYHAVLVRMSAEPERYFIRDLSSVSGILVNGAGAYQRVLSEGDTIRIAGFDLEYGGEAAPAMQRSRLRLVASRSATHANAATAFTRRLGSRLSAGNNADRDEIMREIVLRTAHIHNAGALLARLMPALVRVLNADRGFAGVFAGQTEEYEEVGATGMQADDQIEIEDANAIRAVMEGNIVREGTTLLAPIRRGQFTIGFVCLDRFRPAPSFTDEDSDFLAGLSRLIVPGSDVTPQFSLPEEPISWPAIFVGRSKQILPVLEAARDAATAGNVLILGENGSGKELVAKTVHDFSRNRLGPFVARNCAALPETLAESELFGYAARSGIANADVHGAPGWFELAHRGTLLLDEVHALSPALQDKLLRVLEDREVWRLGARAPVKVDVVVISATDKDLAEAVESGLFRKALFHRFARRLYVPPLRERKDDIRLLVHYFIDKFAAERDRKTRTISQRALEELMKYDWPGNVRELQNCIANCLSHAGEILFSWDLPAELRAPRSAADEAAPSARQPAKIVPMEEVEREKIGEALRSTRGNITRASQLLGYKSRQTMLNKMDQYGIPRDYGDTSAAG